MDKIYFPSLNGLRFYAAISVVIVHIEQIKGWFGLPPAAFSLDGLLMNGDDAVTLFFALSGFLITYLLLAEQARTGTIHVRKFYARRILRIWPLYYLLVFVGFVLMPLLPLDGYTGLNSPRTPEALLAHILFVPNVLPHFLIWIAGITHLWTIGVEEQFYLLWPLLLRRCARYVLPMMVGIIALKMMVFGLRLLTSNADAWFYQITDFLTAFRIENMAVGGLGAYLLFTKHPALKVVFHPVVEKAILLTVVAHTMLAPGGATTPGHLALSVLYTVFMLNVTRKPRVLEHPILNRLGEVSYGIYMYHLVVIHVLIVLLRSSGLMSDGLLYISVPVVTIGIAAVSYHWFEQPFLRLKDRFAASTRDPLYPKFDPSMPPDSRAGG